MALGRLQASLASVTNELTVAAANLNFDFTLVKIEVPEEYQALGHVLSKKRKDNAESGQIHILARRLGALFEGVCPPTPKLVKAYGTRVSEISATANASLSQDPKGLLADHSGVDGTSIWAAATSSITAIHVQLLACLIARLWNGPEAISIWVELIKERRKEVAASFEAGASTPFKHLAAAAQADISRSELANWDASARAWLPTADSTKSRQQKQLLLMLDNVDVPVSQDLTLSSSITSAWTFALKTMEMLINGMPQAVHDGSVLLALGAWHMYPDLVVLGGESVDVRMGDPLFVPGGTLTLGIQHRAHEEGRGVYWSLPLAHLRHYGPPVRSERQLGFDAAKVSFTEFVQAVLGSLFEHWKIAKSNFVETAKLLLAINAYQRKNPIREGPLAKFQDSSHWLHLIAEAALAYLDKDDIDCANVHRLFSLGQRRSSRFIGPQTNFPVFNLCRTREILACMKGPSERITYLRHTALQELPAGTEAVIRYVNPSQIDSDTESEEPYLELDRADRELFSEYTSDGNEIFWHGREYASVFQQVRTISKRKYSAQNGQSISRHCRWIQNKEVINEHGDEDYVQITRNTGFAELSNDMIVGLIGGPWANKRYRRVFGDAEYAELFLYVPSEGTSEHSVDIQQDGTPYKERSNYRPLAEDIIWCLEKDLFLPQHFFHQIHSFTTRYYSLGENLEALHHAAKIYKLLPDATVAIATLNNQLQRAQWAMSMSSTVSVSRDVAFSCIAYLETGLIDIAPSRLEDVFAMSSDNSLYISMQLLCDPTDRPRQYEVKRVLGNVGKPGISMLLPPREPMMRQSLPESWKMINNFTFNGRAENHFTRTSLHLSFTDFNAPVYDLNRGQLDTQMFFLEAVVSVHDAGAWVADIDIPAAMSSGKLQIMKSNVSSRTCSHEKGLEPDQDMVSIENWDEIFDQPDESCVVRASEDWVARLAVTTVLVQQLGRDKDTGVPEKKFVAVCPKDTCWRCVAVPKVEATAQGPRRDNIVYVW